MEEANMPCYVDESYYDSLREKERKEKLDRFTRGFCETIGFLKTNYPDIHKELMLKSEFVNSLNIEHRVDDLVRIKKEHGSKLSSLSDEEILIMHDNNII